MIDIQKNKEELILLLRTYVTREGAQVERFIEYLEKSDFFYAPASTKYHLSVDGGLCQHSLNVFYRLKKLVMLEYNIITDDDWSKSSISLDTIAVVSICHDLDKMNKYEKFKRNVEDPSHPNANSGGWVKVEAWRVKEQKNRFIFGSHGQNSMCLAEQFFPLSRLECMAILHHMGGKESGIPYDDTITEVFNYDPLISLLHVADLLSAYIDERLS